MPIKYAACSPIQFYSNSDCSSLTIKGRKPVSGPGLISCGIDNPVQHENCFGSLSFDGNPLVSNGGVPWYTSYPCGTISCPCPENRNYTISMGFSWTDRGELRWVYSYHCQLSLDSRQNQDVVYYAIIDVKKSMEQGAVFTYGAYTVHYRSSDNVELYRHDYPDGFNQGFCCMRTIDVPGCSFSKDYAIQFAVDQARVGWDRLSKAINPISDFDVFNTALSTVTSLGMNNLENLSQIRDISKMLPCTKGVASSAKVAANMYLWYRYVFQTTASDVRDIVDNIDYISDVMTGTMFRTYKTSASKSGSTVVDGSKVSVISKHTVTFAPDTSSASLRAWHKSHALGLDLSLQNVWDLVPFSFVADWFFQVDDILGGVDNAASASNYILKHGCSGVKYSTDIVTRYGTVTTTRYERSIYTKAPQYRLVLGSPTIEHHWWDAAALCVANK